MKVVIWIVQVLTALVFLAAGSMKLITPYAEFAATPEGAWAGDFSEMQIKIISILEILGALGLILPMFFKKFSKLVPIASIGLALIMIGAIITHLGREESIIPNVVILVLTLLTFWWRKGLLKSS